MVYLQEKHGSCFLPAHVFFSLTGPLGTSLTDEKKQCNSYRIERLLTVDKKSKILQYYYYFDHGKEDK